MSKLSVKVAGVAVLYGALTSFFYSPFLQELHRFKFLLPLSVFFAALGAFFLSRKWVVTFSGSVLSGILYGFGSFFLGLASYHPFCSVLAGAVPWLFLPSVYAWKRVHKLLAVLLLALPVAAIAGFFALTGLLGFYPMASREMLGISDLFGLVFPIVFIKHTGFAFGFYHAALATILMGLFISFEARKWGLLALLAGGMVMGFLPPVFGISPLMWLCLPAICLAVAGGVGMQGLVCAGRGDKGWILAVGAIMLGLCAASFFLAFRYVLVFAGLGEGYSRIFAFSGKMYAMGAGLAAVLFCLIYLNIRSHWLRWLLIWLCVGADILFSVRHVLGWVL